MSRAVLDEKSGWIYWIPGEENREKDLEVLGKALCMNTAKLAREVGVPESEIQNCKNAGLAAIDHNLKKVGEILDQKPAGG